MQGNHSKKSYMICIIMATMMLLANIGLQSIGRVKATNKNYDGTFYDIQTENDAIDDLDNIHELGEGWVAEETLGISLYCALRHQDDFSAGVIAAVNHSGDSDSTGAVTGNILGALLGYAAIR